MMMMTMMIMIPMMRGNVMGCDEACKDEIHFLFELKLSMNRSNQCNGASPLDTVVMIMMMLMMIMNDDDDDDDDSIMMKFYDDCKKSGILAMRRLAFKEMFLLQERLFTVNLHQGLTTKTLIY